MTLFYGIWRDLKLAARSLAKARAFTAVCVLSLGIGMVPVIAVPYGSRMFTTPPAGLNTEGLVEVVTTRQAGRQETYAWSYPDYVALRDAGIGAQLLGWASAPAEVALDPSLGGTREVGAMFASANYLDVLGERLAQGSGFFQTADPLAIVSHAFWQHRLAAAPNVVGMVIPINDVPHTIVGVTREGFHGHLGFQNVEVWLPLERHPSVLADTTIRFDRAREWVRVHGRLQPAVTVEQASAAVAALTAQLAKEHAATNDQKAGVVQAYHPLGVLDGVNLPIVLTIVQALAALPLLVVCLNIAGMVQVRGAMRERELSIRQAIGATRKRLIQQLLAEAVVLAAAGAALASVVLFNVVPLVGWWTNEPLPPALTHALQVDVSMIAICVALCLPTSLVFGWLPAARFSRPVIITVLKDDAGGGRARVGRVQRVATAMQVAIATPLLILSGMTLDRVRATATDHLGFDAEQVYAAPLSLEGVTPDVAAARIEGARLTLATSAGVESVTLADGLPLDFRYRLTRVATQPADQTAPRVVISHVTRVADDYLQTLGITLIRGRAFGPEDQAGAEPVALLSKPLAERLFPEQDPVGQRVTFGDAEPSRRTLTVIGVTSDFPTSQMSTDRAQVLLPLSQYPDVVRDSVKVNDDRGGGAGLMLIARGASGAAPAGVTAALEQVVRDLDPEYESTRTVTGTGLRRFSVDDFLTQSAVSGVVGGVLLLLAALGIYGVVGLMVATRIREIAVRVALGATRPRVLRMILFDVVKLVLPGVIVGVLLAVAFVKLNGPDFGIALSDFEPLAYVAGAAFAVLMALTASLAPARRAASIHPMAAMRSE